MNTELTTESVSGVTPSTANQGLTWPEIFEMKLSDLLDWQLRTSHPQQRHYIALKAAYLQSQAAELLEASSRLQESGAEPLELIARLRVAIRTNAVTEQLIAEAVAQSPTDPLWRGEFFCTLAWALQTQAQWPRAQDYFLLARRCFAEIGCHKRSLQAHVNAVICARQVDTSSNYLAELRYIAAKAQIMGASATAGVAYLNIATMYHSIGGGETALRYVNSAVEGLATEAGCIHYYYAHLLRGRIYFELGRTDEARLDGQVAAASPFAEVRILAKKLVAVAQTGAVRVVATEETLPTDVSAAFCAPSQLTGKESELLRLLEDGPKSRLVLIEKIYGDRIDFVSASNRFKVLLSRLRKKKPGLVVAEANMLKISNAIFLEAKRGIHTA